MSKWISIEIGMICPLSTKTKVLCFIEDQLAFPYHGFPGPWMNRTSKEHTATALINIFNARPADYVSILFLIIFIFCRTTCLINVQR